MTGSFFIAPLPPRGWRKLRDRVRNPYRAWRFKHSRRWIEVGFTEDWDK